MLIITIIQGGDVDMIESIDLHYNYVINKYIASRLRNCLAQLALVSLIWYKTKIFNLVQCTTTDRIRAKRWLQIAHTKNFWKIVVHIKYYAHLINIYRKIVQVFEMEKVSSVFFFLFVLHFLQQGKWKQINFNWISLDAKASNSIMFNFFFLILFHRTLKMGISRCHGSGEAKG